MLQIKKKVAITRELGALTSILQWTTPRRPYVIDGTSRDIQLELLQNIHSKRPYQAPCELPSDLTSIASTSPMRSYMPT